MSSASPLPWKPIDLKQRNQDQAQRYHHEMLGFNYRMDGIQGAVRDVKLQYLDEWNRQRRAHAHNTYDRLLAGCSGFRLTHQRADSECVHHLYVVRSGWRDAPRNYLAQQGIDSGLHYSVPIHLQRAYAGLGYRTDDFPITEDACAMLLSLPMYVELTPAQVRAVACAIHTFQMQQVASARRDMDLSRS
jgi:dTDP-4-amino-4,6-dideoxygalactose transaminase